MFDKTPSNFGAGEEKNGDKHLKQRGQLFLQSCDEFRASGRVDNGGRGLKFHGELRLSWRSSVILEIVISGAFLVFSGPHSRNKHFSEACVLLISLKGLIYLLVFQLVYYYYSYEISAIQVMDTYLGIWGYSHHCSGTILHGQVRHFSRCEEGY